MFQAHRPYNVNIIQKTSFEFTEKLAKEYYFGVLHGQKIRVPALDSQVIIFSRSGWNHFVEKKRSLNELINRLYALPRVPLVLASATAVIEYEKRNKDKLVVEYWTFEEVVEFVTVRVIACAIDNGPKFFLSCIWKGQAPVQGTSGDKKIPGFLPGT